MERRLAEIHIVRARSLAFRLSAFCGAVYPGEWGPPYVEQIVPDLLEFAFHARRVDQLCGVKDFALPSINVFQVKISQGGPDNWQYDYRSALDRLVHIKSFKFGSAHADHRPIYTKAESNLIPVSLAWRIAF